MQMLKYELLCGPSMLTLLFVCLFVCLFLTQIAWSKQEHGLRETHDGEMSAKAKYHRCTTFLAI